MPQSASQIAYARIKALENNQTPLPLPAPTDTIVVGTIDAQSGAFSFLVPTFQQTIRDPSPPGKGAVNRPIELTVGVVATNCVNLMLAFEVTNVTRANAPPPQEAARMAVNVGSTAVAGGTGDVTISGFPSGGVQGARILLNAGLAASALLDAPTVTPGVETFSVGITVHGQLTYQHISILRPPVLGVGAFTIPALLVAIVFAPPQGKLGKNSNSFADKVTTTTTTTISVSNQTDTKTAQAYTAADLAGKVAELCRSGREFDFRLRRVDHFRGRSCIAHQCDQRAAGGRHADRGRIRRRWREESHIGRHAEGVRLGI